MYWVGSAGAVDPADIGKVVCSGSVLQLGGLSISPPPVTGGGVPPPIASSEAVAEISVPSFSATVRYAVLPDDDLQVLPDAPSLPVISGTSVDELSLAVRYRPGDGHIVADLMEIPFYLIDIEDPGTVQEISLLHLDSVDSPASVTFQSAKADGWASADSSHVLDFDNNSYYVLVSLTAPAIETAYPPAIAALGVVQNPVNRLP